jgi:mannitol PTS system EIICBA or EIICB component
LLAYSVFGTGVAKNTAPAAAIIQFFGGIHEIYFPFVLLKPITLLATISGGAVGILTLVIFNAGLRAPAAPGSIIAVLAQTPGNSIVGVVLSVTLAAITSFLITSVILKASRKRDVEEGDLAAATARMEGMKGKESSVSSVLAKAEEDEAKARTEPIRKIVFACDAGMGSSAMGASVLRNKLKKAGFEDVSVVNVAIANLDDTYDLVVTHQDLTLRAMDKTPSAQHVSVSNFMASPKYDAIVDEVQETNATEGSGAPS